VVNTSRTPAIYPKIDINMRNNIPRITKAIVAKICDVRTPARNTATSGKKRNTIKLMTTFIFIRNIKR
jgi:hypothetical protein